MSSAASAAAHHCILLCCVVFCLFILCRPAQGWVEPGNTRICQITMNAQSSMPEKSQNKFLVQYVAVAQEAPVSSAEADNELKSLVSCTSPVCHYLMATHCPTLTSQR